MRVQHAAKGVEEWPGASESLFLHAKRGGVEVGEEDL